MKSTFHEVELGRAVVQNSTATGTEQLVVALHPESQSAVHIQIKENIDGNSPVVSEIHIDQQSLRKLFHWLSEEGILT